MWVLCVENFIFLFYGESKGQRSLITFSWGGGSINGDLVGITAQWLSWEILRPPHDDCLIEYVFNDLGDEKRRQ